MPLSSGLAPGFVRFAYTGSSEPHHAILPILPSGTMTPGNEPSFEQKGGGTLVFTTAMENYLDFYAPMFAPETSFGIAEVYAVDPDTGIRTFIYAIDLAETGSAPIDPQVPLVEGVFVFKCDSGKPLKFYTMEGVFAADARNVGTPPAGVRADFAAYITGDDNFVRGRSNAWPLAFISFTSKVNDRLRVQSGFSNF